MATVKSLKNDILRVSPLSELQTLETLYGDLYLITLLYSPNNAAAQFLNKSLTALTPIEVCKGLLFKAGLLLTFSF